MVAQGSLLVNVYFYILLPSFQKIKKRWIWSMWLLIMMTQGMSMFFFFLQSLEHFLKTYWTLKMPFEQFDSGIKNDNARSRGSDLDGIVFSGLFLSVSDVVST